MGAGCGECASASELWGTEARWVADLFNLRFSYSTVRVRRTARVIGRPVQESSGVTNLPCGVFLLYYSLALDMERPPQRQYDENWDAAVDLTLRRFVYGSLSGAASALLLFRSPSTRWAAVAFGAGAGIGSAFTDSSKLFRGSFGDSSPSISSSSPAVVPDVQRSSVNPLPEPLQDLAPQRSEEPVVKDSQQT